MVKCRKINDPGQLVVSLIALAAAIVAVTVAAIGLHDARLLKTRLDAAPSSSAAARGYLDTTNCCRYSHPDLPALIRDLRTFVRTAIRGNVPFAYERADNFTFFVSSLPDFETPYVNNTYLQGLAALRSRTLAIMQSNTDSLEDIQLRGYVNELDYVLNLTALDAHFMLTTVAYTKWGWTEDPWATAAVTLQSLLYVTSEPDFMPRVLSWLAQLDAKADRWPAFAARALAAGKVHANLTLTTQYNITFGSYVAERGYAYSFTANYTAFCGAANFTGNASTTCLALAASIETKLAAFHTWWTTTYEPAAALLRPDTAPGLSHVAGGEAIYATLQRYHVGRARTGPQLAALAAAGLAELDTNLTALAPVVLGNGFATQADLLAALADKEDSRFNLCAGSQSFPIADFYTQLGLMEPTLLPVVGTAARTPTIVTAQGSDFYYVGVANATTGFWTEPAYFERRDLGTCSGGRAYGIATLRSTIAKEVWPGRGHMLSSLSLIDCSFFNILPDIFDDLWQGVPFSRSANGATSEGWPLFADFLAREVSVSLGSAANVAGSFFNRIPADILFATDVCLHASNLSAGQNCTAAEAVARMAAYGLTTEFQWDNIERFIAQPGEALSYRAGEIALRELRTELRASVLAGTNTTLSDAEFTNLYVRFGRPDIHHDFARLVNVYARRINGTAVSATEFGADLIPGQLYGDAGRPVVGVGREPHCSPVPV